MSSVQVGPELRLWAVPGLPLVQPGDALPELLLSALERAGEALLPQDVVVVTSKLCSRAEGRFRSLARVTPSERAQALARQCGKDPRLVELILAESQSVSRVTPGALIVRHRLGFVVANAGIDASNAQPARELGEGPWVLLLPEAPDASAARLRHALEARVGAPLGVVLSDSFGRPFRLGTVGTALGVAGLPALWDQRGRLDLHGRALEHTFTALGDQLAAAADLVAGQAAEARPVVIVRGLRFTPSEQGAEALLRPAEEDLYA